MWLTTKVMTNFRACGGFGRQQSLLKTLTLPLNCAGRFAAEAVALLVLKKLTVPAQRHGKRCAAAAEPSLLPHPRS